MTAYRLNECARIPRPERLSVADALAGVRELMTPGRSYEIAWHGVDGKIIKTYLYGPEAWLVATPVGKDGKYLRGADLLVCPVGLGSASPAVARRLRRQLAALLEENG